MLFHAFYNVEGCGDVLLTRVKKGTTSYYKTFDDIVALYNTKDEIIGYNFLQASKYFEKLKNGMIDLSKEDVNIINELLIKQNLDEVEYQDVDTFVVGKVIELEMHPDSDHLHIAKVDINKEVLQIVCGASNIALNQLVVVATIGTIMPSGLEITPSSLRGVPSHGMLCSAKELNIPGEFPKGILVLEDTKYEIGKRFY